MADVTWLSAAGNEMTPEHWDDPSMRCFGLLLDGRARTRAFAGAADATAADRLNAHHDVVEFSLPDVAGSDSGPA